MLRSGDLNFASTLRGYFKPRIVAVVGDLQGFAQAWFLLPRSVGCACFCGSGQVGQNS